MTEREIIEKGHIELGCVEFGTEKRLIVCDHIELLADKTGAGNGEYQEELSIFCKVCKKIYKFVCEVQ